MTLQALVLKLPLKVFGIITLLPDIAIVVYGKLIASHNGHQPLKITSLKEVKESKRIYHIEIDNPELTLGITISRKWKGCYCYLI